MTLGRRRRYDGITSSVVFYQIRSTSWTSDWRCHVIQLPDHHCILSVIVMSQQNILIVGATRGPGKELAKQYHEAGHNVSGTGKSSGVIAGVRCLPLLPARSETPDDRLGIRWITGVDVSESQAGTTIVSGLRNEQQDVVIVSAGYFPKESIDEPDFDKEVFTYKVCAIGPVFVVHSLWKAGLLKQGSKVIRRCCRPGAPCIHEDGDGGWSRLRQVLARRWSRDAG